MPFRLVRHPTLSETVEQYLTRCFEQESPPRVKELAYELGIERWILSRSFRCNAGCTLSEHMRWRQIEYACLLLTQTSLDTTTIGYRAGFHTRATFFRVFRTMMNCTPAAFRKGTPRVVLHGEAETA